MPQVTIENAIRLADEYYQRGQLAEAEQAYREILARQPRHAHALYRLGLIAAQLRRYDIAARLIADAIAMTPQEAEWHSNLGNALAELGKFSEAISAYRDAIARNPNYAEAFNNLGYVLRETKQFDQAIASCRRAIALKPGFAEAYNNLGFALICKRQFDEAISACRQSIACRPDYPEAHCNLGTSLMGIGEVDDAIGAYRQAILHRNNYCEAHYNLGGALRNKGLLDEAATAFRQALALRPQFAEAHNNLGNTLKDKGLLPEAMTAFQTAVACRPDYYEAHSNMVYTLYFLHGENASAMYQEARRWNDQHAKQLAGPPGPLSNNLGTDRVLRIGYVSANFRQHPVGTAILPLLKAHDRARFQIICYYNARGADAITQQCIEAADEWRNIDSLPDHEVVNLVREDRIDILVDLDSHMANHRLLVFARKPAPVQVTYLGHQGTTGLDTMDYRISDPHIDPPGPDDAFYTEKIIRLPNCYLCFVPVPQSPPVIALPALAAGFVTFGSLNNFCKVTPQVLELWARILAGLPNSRLILRCPAGEPQQRVLNLFARNGIAPARINLHLQRLESNEYLQLHNNIDIYLDTFPHAGHTTSIDALWMGLPVITLAGRTAVGRGGVSLLTTLDLKDLIANTQAEYLEKALGLAEDFPRLVELRRTLRTRIEHSPLMDAQQLARDVETAYGEMWRQACHISR